MDKKSKILIIIVVVVLISSIGFTYYKTIIQNNFDVVEVIDETSNE